MKAAAELTLNVTEFKAKSLRLLDDLAAGRLDRIVVTKRGQPLATISPPAARHVSGQDWYGSMRGTMTIAPGVDLTAPVIDWDWEAEMMENWDKQNG